MGEAAGLAVRESWGSSAAGRRGRAFVQRSPFAIVPFVIVHLPLALTIYWAPAFAGVHALFVFSIGLWWAVAGTRPERVVYCAAYIAGAEVLWRAVGARIFWEFGKYAIVALLGIAVLRFVRVHRGVWMAAVYFLLLVPSSLLTLQRIGLNGDLRDQISFNLSGPLALAVAVIFFRQMSASWNELRMVMWSMVAPVAGIATITLYSITAASEISFGQESNFVASGGYGPNQVSAALGLGAMLCIFLAVLERAALLKMVAITLFLWFMGHSLLTFSRGGALNVVIAMAFAAANYVRAPKTRTAVLSFLAALTIVMLYVVVPRLDLFTGGLLRERFTTPETTRRGELAGAELQVWRDHPLVGIGPGGLGEVRSIASGTDPAAHTEMTRLLAEHGLAGLAAICLLISMMVAAYRRARDPSYRAWVVALAAWALVEMTHSAMRIAAISFCFGLMMLALRTAEPPRRSAVER